MHRRLFFSVLAVLATLSLLGCASRNDVCETCIERTDERLMDASAQLYPDAVRRIRDEGGSINAKDRYGETPLMKALRQPPSRSMESMRPLEKTVAGLLDAGADVDVVNTRGTSTVSLAVATGNLEVLKLFDAKISDSQRDSMFMQALSNRQYQAALYLLETGANPAQSNERNQSALHLAVNSPAPSPELVGKLLYTNDVRQMDAWGTTPLMTACANGAPLEIVRQLIQHGADKNLRFNGNSLLYLALVAGEENIELVKYLLRSGFSPDETDAARTPLIVLMAKADRIRSVKALAEAGADTTVLDRYGLSDWQSRLNILLT